ncbi:MAG: leucine-rich repeat domain-containing protein [Clostridia bacterium]|nr:leucine-rich repeat domain-containing protein [Clostridia bacterium]
MSILPRRFRREKEREQELIQDGFSAPVVCVTPRPWRDEEDAWSVPLDADALQSSPRAAARDEAAAQQYAPPAYKPPVYSRAAQNAAEAGSAPYAQRTADGGQARPSAPRQSHAAYAMAGRRVIDFADNGDGTLTAARCTDPMADDLDIQFEAGGCPVTAIAPHAFDGCAALRRVILPQGLRQIGEMAFLGCIHLTKLTIPGSVTRVGTLAFAKCTGLERVRIEPGVQALGPSCFSKCTALARVDVPASLVSFGGGVFFGCGRQLCLYGAEGNAAQQYAQMNGLKYDSENWKEDEELVLSELEDGTLMVMGPRNADAARIEIPSEVCGRRISRIAEKAFFALPSLTLLSVSGGVREIGESAFFGCRQLSCVRFERGLERVGDSAFAGCENLSEVTLPWGTGAVGRMAFFGCSRLSFVKMPATTRVADFAFDHCAAGLRVFGGVNAGRIRDIHRDIQRG